MNISSLSYHFDNLHTVLASLELKFDILDITEIRFKKNCESLINCDHEGYVTKHTPTESSCGRALLYINKNINYICRTDLEIYKEKDLESGFIETVSPTSKNAIIGCINRHPCMETPGFLESHLKELLRKINKEKKKIIMLGDFNINILKYNTVKDSIDFLDIMTEAFLFPHISSPTRITPRSRTLTDNIFSSNIEHDTLSGNITTTISDHFAQFPILKDLSHKQDLKKDIYKND